MRRSGAHTTGAAQAIGYVRRVVRTTLAPAPVALTGTDRPAPAPALVRDLYCILREPGTALFRTQASSSPLWSVRSGLVFLVAGCGLFAVCVAFMMPALPLCLPALASPALLSLARQLGGLI